VPIDGIYRKHHLFRKQFVADASDVQDLDAWVFGEGTAQAGDENLEAAGVEKVVVTPEDGTFVISTLNLSRTFASGEIGNDSIRPSVQIQSEMACRSGGGRNR